MDGHFPTSHPWDFELIAHVMSLYGIRTIKPRTIRRWAQDEQLGCPLYGLNQEATRERRFTWEQVQKFYRWLAGC